MNFKTRFLILIVINVTVLMLMFSLFFNSNIDLSTRLIDLNFSDQMSRSFFLKFMAVLLIGFAANFLAGLGKNDLSEKEIEAIAEVLSHQQ